MALAIAALNVNFAFGRAVVFTLALLPARAISTPAAFRNTGGGRRRKLQWRQQCEKSPGAAGFSSCISSDAFSANVTATAANEPPFLSTLSAPCPATVSPSLLATIWASLLGCFAGAIKYRLHH